MLALSFILLFAGSAVVLVAALRSYSTSPPSRASSLLSLFGAAASLHDRLVMQRLKMDLVSLGGKSHRNRELLDRHFRPPAIDCRGGRPHMARKIKRLS